MLNTTAPTTPDTILAVSSPPGTAARGLIRISGPGTDAALERVLSEVPEAVRETRSVRLKSPAIPALLTRFAAPRSYTGEDSAELQLPGNASLLDRVLKQLTAAASASQLPTFRGVRLAEPGEFTFRAYTAGKIDLTQAEGISATISATCDSQLRAAGLLRQGKLGTVATNLVDRLGNALALVEAGIDFTDQEDVVPIAPSALLEQLDRLLSELDDLLSRSRSWGAIASPPWVVLVGPPSAGKSTLFNALLGIERAVIDPSPGTTRDVLVEPLRLRRPSGEEAEVMLVDIAGLDEVCDATTSLPDHAAQAAARDAIGRADLVLRVSDKSSVHLSHLDTASPTLRVQTKCDTHDPTTSPHREVGVQATESANPRLAVGAIDKQRDEHNILRVNAVTGEGLPQLRAAIIDALGERAVSIAGDMLALQPRHEAALHAARQHLADTRDRLAVSADAAYLLDIELLAASMRDALDTLAGLGGQLTPDEIIGRVFATFCVGK